MHRAALCGFFVVQAIFLGSLSIAQIRIDSSDHRPFDPAHFDPADTLCDWDYSTEDSSLISFQYFLPAVFRDESTLKRYIRDPRFQQLRRTCSDTLAVDAIFARAFDIADGTMSHALLIATLATFDHFRLGIKIPLVGAIYLPLTIVESRRGFTERYSRLPRHVLPDIEGLRKRDRDKLQHFFGSAYLTYIFSSKTIANYFGDFIEWGEPPFIVGGDYDERDKFANHLGQEFGMRLLDGEEVMPSDVLWRK
ncbi:MAG: hypothetical protein WBZ48_05035 [Bacteroidota bacterium]